MLGGYVVYGERGVIPVYDGGRDVERGKGAACWRSLSSWVLREAGVSWVGDSEWAGAAVGEGWGDAIVGV